MTCEQTREHFAALLDFPGRPPREPAPAGAELDAARAHLAHCPTCQREFAALNQTLSALDTLPSPAPSTQLRRGFYAMLEEEKNSAASVRLATARERRRHGWRWVLAPFAGAALVAAGFLAGQRFRPAPAVAPAAAVADADTRQQLQELRTKVDRLESMNQLVAASLTQPQLPASERLKTVLTTSSESNPSDQVLTELITSLALDPSANVRLRALEALYAHADRDLVRAGVLSSLARESNPLVQVAMIDFLAAARDREAKPALEKMATNQLADGNVRAAAKRALAQL